MINKDFEDFLKCLNHNKVKYLIVGGYAHVYYTEPRYTKDLDILIEPTRKNAKRVYKSICDFLGGPIENLSPEDFINPDKFFVLGAEPNRVDIFSELPGIVFSEAWKRKVSTKFGNVPVWVIGYEDLVRNFEEVKKQVSEPELISKYDYFLRRLKAWQEKK